MIKNSKSSNGRASDVDMDQAAKYVEQMSENSGNEVSRPMTASQQAAQ